MFGWFTTIFGRRRSMVDRLPKMRSTVVVTVRSGPVIVAVSKSRNLRTISGRDWMVAQTLGTPGSKIGYVALSDDTADPALNDTTLTGEITDTGLARTAVALAFTSGASSATLSATFSPTTTRTIRKAGLFTGSGGGNAMFITKLTSPIVTANGLTMIVRWTIDFGT